MHPMRLVDIVSSIAALIVLSPLLVLLAVWLKLTRSGPVFCLGDRVRPNGGHVRLLKFCTQRTSLGMMMRRFSIDELPSFISVLLGEASLMELHWK
jgi:lipopolysaccharide/colanic/teichoic acid biosynthesis glycosyltransferase